MLSLQTHTEICEMQPSTTKEEINKQWKEKILETYHELVQSYKKVRKNIDFINDHSLSPEKITIIDFVDDIIKKENEQKENKYKLRIQCLKILSEMQNADSRGDEYQQAKQFIQCIQNKQA